MKQARCFTKLNQYQRLGFTLNQLKTPEVVVPFPGLFLEFVLCHQVFNVVNVLGDEFLDLFKGSWCHIYILSVSRFFAHRTQNLLSRNTHSPTTAHSPGYDNLTYTSPHPIRAVYVVVVAILTRHQSNRIGRLDYYPLPRCGLLRSPCTSQ
jgi:hypothetical protein